MNVNELLGVGLEIGSSRDSEFRRAVMIFSSEEEMSDIREFLKNVDMFLRKNGKTDGRLVVSKETLKGSYPSKLEGGRTKFFR